MGIFGTWPITNAPAMSDRFGTRLIVEKQKVVITELDDKKKAKVDVYDSNGALYITGTVSYNADKDSIQGNIARLDPPTEVSISAYAMLFDTYWYIFGFAMTKGSADSGGQWDGNRPK